MRIMAIGSFVFAALIFIITILFCWQRQEASTATWLAFVSDRDGNREIYRMLPDGRGIKRLTYHVATDTEPT